MHLGLLMLHNLTSNWWRPSAPRFWKGRWDHTGPWLPRMMLYRVTLPFLDCSRKYESYSFSAKLLFWLTYYLTAISWEIARLKRSWCHSSRWRDIQTSSITIYIFYGHVNNSSRTSASSMSGVYPPMPENGPVYWERTSGGRSGIVSVWAMVIEDFGEEADYGKGCVAHATHPFRYLAGCQLGTQTSQFLAMKAEVLSPDFGKI